GAAERVRQRRWTILLRLFLAVPALLVSGGVPLGFANFFATSDTRTRTRSFGTGGGSLLAVSGSLGWFASLAVGRMPKGLRDAGAWSIGYTAQTSAYVLLLTDRYPNADPVEMLAGVERPERHPVRIVRHPYDLPPSP